jgi:hypothetical protein
MLASIQDIAFLDNLNHVVHRVFEVLRQHCLDLGVAYDCHIRMAEEKIFNGSGMIWLHVMDNQIVKLSIAKPIRDIFEECVGDSFVAGVEQDSLIIEKQIRIVGDSVRNAIDAFEAAETAVIRTNPHQVFQYLFRAVHNV